MVIDKPKPPSLPKSESQFTEHVITHPTDWYKYCQAAYDFIENHWHSQDELEGHTTRLQARVTELESQLYTAQMEKTEPPIEVEYQAESHREELNLSSRGLFEAELAKEKDSELTQSMASSTASTPKTDPALQAAEDHVARTASAVAVAFSESTGQPEDLSGPGMFTMEREDIRRFVAQLHEQLVTKHEQFPCPEARRYYIISQISGTPYSQLLPYIWDGVCQLEG